MLFLTTRPSVKLYRKNLILRILLVLMLAVDVLAVFFTPVWALVLFLVVHLIILIVWIQSKCQLMDTVISELLE